MSYGVGLRVTLRCRMGAHDAHYAGELVDGARMLALFGDVATELLIRMDGDEGLFGAYESVEFLAPVLAGDYIEARGVVTRVGSTSRQIAFEARKVVGNLTFTASPQTTSPRAMWPLQCVTLPGLPVYPAGRINVRPYP